ncbi:MAG: hypothetical protein M0010_21095 [Actinomycetota bacterium]|nr:hypothetical protein [Actinomycetota bacterium]MDA8356748.1 hypothetical protein [Actinomycetota bacterium]
MTSTVFSLQFLRRYLKVDAVVVASGGTLRLGYPSYTTLAYSPPVR